MRQLNPCDANFRLGCDLCSAFSYFRDAGATAIALLVALVCASTVVRAGVAADTDHAATPALYIDGFGTLGAVHASEHQADFTGSSFKAVGAGYTSAWSAAVDSRVGLQAVADLTAKIFVVLQVIAEQNSDNSYSPHVEWANVRYQVTPDLDVRVGRTSLPIFMDTDSRKIGFTSPWVRPPVELYSLVGVTNNDGIDASYRAMLGLGANIVQLTAGGSDSKFPSAQGFSAGSVRARKLATISDTFEYGFSTFRINYGRARVTIATFDPLFDAFRQFGPQGVAVASRYDVHDRSIEFFGVGASYDPGNWFLRGEWGYFDTNSIVGTSSAWYVSGGRRFGRFTPYVTYAALRADSAKSDPGLTVSALPPPFAAPATQLNAVLNGVLSSIAAQSTTSAGVRWDVFKNVDFKFQADHSRVAAGSPGIYSNVQPGHRTGGVENLLSATIDFVF